MMRRKWALRLAVLSFVTAPLYAEELVTTSKTLDDVLAIESTGNAIDRRVEIDHLNLNDSASQWHAGRIQKNGEWVPADMAFELSKAEADYYQRRGAEHLDAASHYKMAVWCKKRGLSDQYRAHMSAVLNQEPNNLRVRMALGHQYVGGSWYSASDIAAAHQMRQERDRNFKQWLPKIDAIVVAMQQGTEAQQNAAHATLQSITDPAAVSSLELAAFMVGDLHCKPFVGALANIKDPESALALARLALATESESLRELAVGKLKDMPPESYIPEVLSLLRTPIEYQVQAVGANGRLAIHRYLTQEDMFAVRQHHHVHQSGGVRIGDAPAEERDKVKPLGFYPVRGFVSDEPVAGHIPWRGTIDFSSFKPQTERIRSEVYQQTNTQLFERSMLNQQAAVLDEARFQKEVEAANAAQAEADKVIYNFLEQVSGQALPADPHSWWAWWQGYNERYGSNSKDRAYTYSYQTDADKVLAISDYQQTPAPNYSCLVAGTYVQTSKGLTPVEQIRIGDLVLSQNTETGELGLKPVFMTTVRPPNQTLKIVTENETIQATAGHRWWVAGKGWLMTKQLEAGMNLHNHVGTTVIKEVVVDELPQETYNLIVEDNHTYFVGQNRVLSYDNANPKPTFCTVPGFRVAAN